MQGTGEDDAAEAPSRRQVSEPASFMPQLVGLGSYPGTPWCREVSADGSERLPVDQGLADSLCSGDGRWLGLEASMPGISERGASAANFVDSLNLSEGGAAGEEGGFPGQGPPQSLGPAVAPPQDWGNTTTIMMRNLPNKYTQRMLLSEINHTGFMGTFDFLYLPIDPDTAANRGYAFLNFIDPGFAWMFKLHFEGKKMHHFNSTKVVSVMPATLQGFEANYAHYASARVNRGDPSARPLFLREPKHGVASLGRHGGRGGCRKRRTPLGEGAAAGGYEASSPWGAVADVGGYFPFDPACGVPSFPAGGPCMGEGLPGAILPRVPQFCPNCGGKILPQFQFCPHCGNPLDFGFEAGKNHGCGEPAEGGSGNWPF